MYDISPFLVHANLQGLISSKKKKKFKDLYVKQYEIKSVT